MGHFAGQTIDWDVVDEAIAYGSPYGLQPSHWLNQGSSGYVEQAFRWAHAADPNAKLFYNDTGGEGLGQVRRRLQPGVWLGGPGCADQRRRAADACDRLIATADGRYFDQHRPISRV